MGGDDLPARRATHEQRAFPLAAGAHPRPARAGRGGAAFRRRASVGRRLARADGGGTRYRTYPAGPLREHGTAEHHDRRQQTRCRAAQSLQGHHGCRWHALAAGAHRQRLRPTPRAAESRRPDRPSPNRRDRHERRHSCAAARRAGLHHHQQNRPHRCLAAQRFAANGLGRVERTLGSLAQGVRRDAGRAFSPALLPANGPRRSGRDRGPRHPPRDRRPGGTSPRSAPDPARGQPPTRRCPLCGSCSTARRPRRP